MKFYIEWSGWNDDLDTFDLGTRVQSRLKILSWQFQIELENQTFFKICLNF